MEKVNDTNFYISIMNKAHSITMELLESEEEIKLSEVHLALVELQILEEVIVLFKKTIINPDETVVHYKPYNDVIKFIYNQKATIRRLFL